MYHLLLCFLLVLRGYFFTTVMITITLTIIIMIIKTMFGNQNPTTGINLTMSKSQEDNSNNNDDDNNNNNNNN